MTLNYLDLDPFVGGTARHPPIPNYRKHALSPPLPGSLSRPHPQPNKPKTLKRATTSPHHLVPAIRVKFTYEEINPSLTPKNASYITFWLITLQGSMIAQLHKSKTEKNVLRIF